MTYHAHLTANFSHSAAASIDTAPEADAGLSKHSQKFKEDIPVHSCNPPDAFRAASPFVADTSNESDDKNEFSINDLAREFELTHRALRFYESRGLLAPQRDGRRRIFSRADRERLAVILKGKKLGFTLTEISEMVEAQAGRATAHGLKLTAEKCVEQIAHFERQIADAKDAITELKRIQALFASQVA
jgi:DNA-binding transcriptional MerR regulator